MRIAQITDLHLRSAITGSSEIAERKSREIPDLFAQTTSHVARDIKPDVIVVSGDLVDVPFELVSKLEAGEASRSERDMVIRDYRLIRNVLDRTKVPYIVLPGNHDWPDAFNIVFSDQEMIREIRDITILIFQHDREGPENVPHRNLSLYEDFQSFTGTIVHVQHYVVTPQLDQTYPHTYGNAQQILRWNSRYGQPVLSISGHFHRGSEPHKIKGTTYTTGAAFCEYPHPWFLYQVETKSRNVTIERYNICRPTPTAV